MQQRTSIVNKCRIARSPLFVFVAEVPTRDYRVLVPSAEEIEDACQIRSPSPFPEFEYQEFQFGSVFFENSCAGDLGIDREHEMEVVDEVFFNVPPSVHEVFENDSDLQTSPYQEQRNISSMELGGRFAVGNIKCVKGSGKEIEQIIRANNRKIKISQPSSVFNENFVQVTSEQNSYGLEFKNHNALESGSIATSASSGKRIDEICNNANLSKDFEYNSYKFNKSTRPIINERESKTNRIFKQADPTRISTYLERDTLIQLPKLKSAYLRVAPVLPLQGDHEMSNIRVNYPVQNVGCGTSTRELYSEVQVLGSEARWKRDYRNRQNRYFKVVL